MSCPTHSAPFIGPGGTYGRSPISSAVGMTSRQISSPRARITTQTMSRAIGVVWRWPVSGSSKRTSLGLPPTERLTPHT